MQANPAYLNPERLLGELCPFGQDYSTKHLSRLSACPDLNEAQAADRLIRKYLEEFLTYLAKTNRTWRSVPLSSFDRLATVANALTSHSPNALDKIYPINGERHAEKLLRDLVDNENPIATALYRVHGIVKAKTGSHRRAAQVVTAAIGKTWPTEILEDDVFDDVRMGRIISDLATEGAVDLSQVAAKPKPLAAPLFISQSALHCLTLYQTIQERLEDAESVDAVNVFLSKRTDVLEMVLGIQVQLCRHLLHWFEEDPSRYAYARAFNEIGLTMPGWPIVVPNSRFLKILVHNLGGSIVEFSDPRPETLLLNAVDRSIQTMVYTQNIPIVTLSGRRSVCLGTVAKACPASAFIGNAIRHFCDES